MMLHLRRSPLLHISAISPADITTSLPCPPPRHPTRQLPRHLPYPLQDKIRHDDVIIKKHQKGPNFVKNRENDDFVYF